MRLVTDLLSNNYLIEREMAETPARRGRPSSMLSINPECGVVAGIEFGHEELNVCYVAADGTQIGAGAIDDIPPFQPTEATLDALVELVTQEARRFDISAASITAIGLAVHHDLVTADGQWVPLRQPLGQSFHPREYIAERYDYFVHIDDISRAFAFAEHRYGAGRGATDMIYLYVGRQGIGAGIFVNDSLLKSASGFCGEVGHIQVEENGLLCQCGNQGCLQTVATYDAVLSQINARLQVGVISSLKQQTPLTFADVCQAYEAGDKLARIVLGQLARHISKALVSTINIVGASRVLIGGKLYLAGDDFSNELTNLVHQQLIPGLTHNVTVGFAELDDYAGAWGSATQALDAAWESGHFLHSQ